MRGVTTTKTVLEARDIHAFYGKSHILHGVSLHLDEGEIVTVLGRNGAGKTTTIDDSGSYVVSGEILNVFCDMYLEFSGQVVLVATVRKDGRELLNKRYEGKGTSGIAVAATAESYAQSLARALASAIRPFVADVDRALISP